MKHVLRVIGWILAALVIVLLVISTLDHLDAFSSEDALYGIDYLPALWLGALAVVPIVLFNLLGERKFAFPLLTVALIYTAAFGDFSLSVFVPKKQLSSRTAKKITVAALNVQYYSHGINEVIDGILSLKP